MQSRGFSALELLIVVALTGVIAAIAVPMMTQAMSDYRIAGDARAVSSSIALAKMRAASAFSQSRFYLDVDGGTYRVETLARGATPVWMQEGTEGHFSTGVIASSGPVDAPPPDTQTALQQAPPCLTTSGDAIGNTACVVFNSRGIPVDAIGAPTSQNAIYFTDDTFVYAATVQASGMVRLWRTGVGETAWAPQ